MLYPYVDYLPVIKVSCTLAAELSSSIIGSRAVCLYLGENYFRIELPVRKKWLI